MAQTPIVKPAAKRTAVAASKATAAFEAKTPPKPPSSVFFVWGTGGPISAGRSRNAITATTRELAPATAKAPRQPTASSKRVETAAKAPPALTAAA